VAGECLPGVFPLLDRIVAGEVLRGEGPQESKHGQAAVLQLVGLQGRIVEDVLPEALAEVRGVVAERQPFAELADRTQLQEAGEEDQQAQSLPPPRGLTARSPPGPI